MVHPCTECHQRFVSQSVLEYHIRVEHQTRVGFSHHKKRKCRQEQRSKSTTSGVNYCNLCHVTIYKGLKSHQHRVHALNSQEKTSLACEECDVKFVSEASAEFHKLILHKGPKTPDCPLCQTRFKKARFLRQHKERIHCQLGEMKAFSSRPLPSDQLRLECPICQKRFLSQNILDYHRLYSHNIRQRNPALTNFMTILNSLK